MSQGFATLPAHGPRYVLANASVPGVFLDDLPQPPDAEGLVAADIVVNEGVVERVAPAGSETDVSAASTSIGGMVWPTFVDMHTHIDKGHIWPRKPNPDGTFASALAAVAADREAEWTAGDVERRMDFSLRAAYAHGTSLLRTHLDSSPPQHRISWPVFAAMRERWAGRIDLQAVSILPIDLFLDAAFADEIVGVVAEHGGVLGAVTYMMPDLDRGARHDDAARRRGRARPRFPCRRDRRSRRPARSAHIADAAIRNGFAGRIVAGHCCSLAMQPADEADATMERVAEAGIAVVSLPMCNMYLQDRVAGRTPRWRGVTLLHELMARDVPVAVASDNTRDPFYAYGDLDMLEVFREAVRIIHLDHPIGAWAAPGQPRAGRDHRPRRPRRHRRRPPRRSGALPRPDLDRTACPPAIRPHGAAGRRGDRPDAAGLPRTRRSDEAFRHDRRRRAEGRPRRHQDRGQSGDRQAEEPRLLLVFAGAQAGARPCHRRPHRLAEDRGRGHPRAEDLLRAGRAGDAARLGHRQLRPGDAAVGRRRAEPCRDERGEVGRAAGAWSPNRARCSPTSTARRARAGQELRLHPSTYNTASIAGFIAGGSGGVGSINWGGLRDLGNVLRLRIVTMEAEPRVLELGGWDLHKVMHAYGTNGIITEVEVPLDVAYDWVDVVVGFDDYMRAVAFANTLANQDGLLFKEIAAVAAPVPHDYFLRHQKFLEQDRFGRPADGRAACHGPVPGAGGAREGGDPLSLRHGERGREEGPAAGLRADLEPHDAEGAKGRSDDHLPPGALSLPGPCREGRPDDRKSSATKFPAISNSSASTAMSPAPACRSSATPATQRLDEIIAIHEDNGCPIFNPHRYTLEEGGMKQTDEIQLAFKREADPKGLLNPGKMVAWENPDFDWKSNKVYLFPGLRDRLRPGSEPGRCTRQPRPACR